MSRPAQACSGTPLPRKLGIREGTLLLLVGAPADFETTLGDLPPGARVTRRGTCRPARAVVFCRSLADLGRRFEAIAPRVADGGSLWVAWPKRASGLAAGLGEREVRSFGLRSGWVDSKICALDRIWSGLCFARRRP